MRMLQQTITSIDPVKRRITTDKGQFEADYLVVALGAEYDFAATPGLADVTEFYSVAGPRGCAMLCRISPRAGR